MAVQIPLKLGPTGSEQFTSTDYVPEVNGGVPAGGSTNEVLKKVSGLDHDAEWGKVNTIDLAVEPLNNQTGEGVFTNSLNAGININAFECVFLGASGTWLLADADAEATSKGMLALAMETKTSGQPIRVALPGTVVRNDAWNWTSVGSPLFISQVSGGITQVIPNGNDVVVRVVGFALTDDSIYFYPSPDYITLNS